MAEYINKSDAIKAVFDCERYTGIDEAPYEYADDLLNKLPTIDIVHCKKCKYSNVDKMGWYCNKHYHRYADENTHFCSDGEVEE